jgi:hypothetical protein
MKTYVDLANNADLIRQTVDKGKVVYVDSLAYVVIRDCIGQYLIHCKLTDSYIGLTWRDGDSDLSGHGKTLNGKRFFMEAE